MTKPYLEAELFERFDRGLIWRRRELSDIKSAIRNANNPSDSVLRRALVAMCYAHWEGFVKECANEYFKYIAVRKYRYDQLERQFYRNKFVGVLEGMISSGASLKAKCDLIDEILDSQSAHFTSIRPKLVDTKSNLNSEVVSDLCVVCGVEPDYFAERQEFIDVFLLKRRNSIAHGEYVNIGPDEVNGFVSDLLALMEHFKTLLENKVTQSDYRA